MIKQIYISGPSTSAPGMVQARQFYEKLGKISRSHGWRPYIPRPVTPEEHHAGITEFDLYQQDSIILKASQLMIAEITDPSSRVRTELSLAIGQGVRIIALLGPERSSSRFTVEMLEEKGALILYYKDEQGAFDLISQTLRSLTQTVHLRTKTSDAILQ
jgi:hypothetical protein